LSVCVKDFGEEGRGLARRLGKAINLNDIQLDMETPPTTEGLLAILARNSAVPINEIRKHPGGRIFDLPSHVVQPPRPDSNASFDVIPNDIREQLAEVRSEPVLLGRYASNGESLHAQAQRTSAAQRDEHSGATTGEDAQQVSLEPGMAAPRGYGFDWAAFTPAILGIQPSSAFELS
jgi:hypothetical protein